MAPTSDSLPAATEAPHLLEAFEQPRPFVSAKRLRMFSFAVLLGASFVGSVYYIVSRALASRCERELEMIRAIAEQTREAEDSVGVDREVIPRFVLPQTYNELVEKMRQADDSAMTSKGPAAHGPLLHQEVIHRAKLAWNEGIFNVQVSLEAYGLEWKRRREEQTKVSIESSIRLLGYEPSELKRIA